MKKKIIGIAAAVIAVCLIIIAVAGLAKPDIRYSEDSHAIVNNNKLEWNLMLINAWNPLKQEKIKLLELRNGQKIDERIYEDLQQMFDDARAVGFDPEVTSGFRAKEKQQELFDEKVQEFEDKGYTKTEAKKAALEWVAEPGYSEHETGLAVDINEIDGNSGRLYQWLEKNCKNYGFILRFPATATEITGVEYEPWHFRYVGHEAAEYITEHGLTLEEYVEKILTEK